MLKLGQALILSLGIVAAACVLAGPPRLEPEPVSVVQAVSAPKMDPADERLFARLQARIDSRVEARVVEACQEAESKRGVGMGVLAAALLRLVTVAIKGAISAIIFAVLVALFWRYCWWIVLGFVGAVVLVAAPTSWLVSRRK